MGRKTVDWQLEKGDARQVVLELELARTNGSLTISDRREKYRRMAESPFAFYRGSAHLFYRDLAAQDLLSASHFNSPEAVTWILGDLHLGNFGAFKDSEAELVFDLNDFDESWVTCYLYDVWRGAASLVLSGRANGFTEEEVRGFVDRFSREYLAELERARGKEGRNLEKVTADKAHGPLRKLLEKAALKKSRKAMLNQWSTSKGNERRFNLGDSNIHPVTEDDHRLITSAIDIYKDHLTSDLAGNKQYFKVQDVARRLGAGIGSLGTPRYYVLIRGETDHVDTTRILDVKEQGMPAFFPYLPTEEQNKLLSLFNEEKAGYRVVNAQKAMLMDPDKHLGAITILGRSFSVRERSPFKKSLKVEKLKKCRDFSEMAHHWGTILAAAHARADKDYCSLMVSYNFEDVVTSLALKQRKSFQNEVYSFAHSYAAQVEEDALLFQNLRNTNAIE